MSYVHKEVGTKLTLEEDYSSCFWAQQLNSVPCTIRASVSDTTTLPTYMIKNFNAICVLKAKKEKEIKNTGSEPY